MTIALPMLVLIFALMIGMPIGFSLATAGTLGIFMVTGSFEVVMGILGTVPYRAVSNYILTTIPMFTLMAYLISASGIAAQLYNAVASWLSHVRGGLAVATVFAGAIFGAMSGSTVAAASVLSNIAYPNMRHHNYSNILSTGAVGLGATLSILIPPSIAMVVYGFTTGTSIGKLLIAGILPGILLAITTALVITVWVRISPHLAPDTYVVSWPDRFQNLLRIWPGVLLILLVVATLYSGIATPTEVAAVGAFGAALIGVAMRSLTWKATLESLRSTVQTSMTLFTIYIGASIFGVFMTMSRVPQHLTAAVVDLDLNRWVVVVAIIIGYFVLSTVMDELPLLLITLPYTFPIITALGFDPVWFGVMSMLMMIMGLIFPPVGMVVFVVSATSRVDLVSVFRGTGVLIIAVFIVTALLLVFPEIATYLPSRMH